MRNALCVVTEADRALGAGSIVETLLKPMSKSEHRRRWPIPPATTPGKYFERSTAAAPCVRYAVEEGAATVRRTDDDGARQRPPALSGRARRTSDRPVLHLLLQRAVDRPRERKIQIGGIAARAHGWLRIWIDRVAQGAIRCGRFRDVPAVAQARRSSKSFDSFRSRCLRGSDPLVIARSVATKQSIHLLVSLWIASLRSQ